MFTDTVLPALIALLVGTALGALVFGAVWFELAAMGVSQ